MIKVQIEENESAYRPWNIYSFSTEQLYSMSDYSTKSNCIRGITRAMNRLGIYPYQIFDENGKHITGYRQG